jgi:polysaccharide export outer membrane protein
MNSKRMFHASLSRVPISCALILGVGVCATAESKKSFDPVPPANTRSDPASNSSPSAGYVIGAGDVLQINILKEPDASVAAATVRSDGVISVPIIKEVSVLGLTPRALEALLTQKFSTLIRDADVTVIVKEIHSEKVYLVGAVRKEGPISLRAPISVLQAIAEGGGLTDYAKRNKLYILRQESAKQIRIPFDYRAVIKGEHTEENIMLRPGDTIVVPQ